MIKKPIILSSVLVALLSVSVIAVAVEFGADSSNISESSGIHRAMPWIPLLLLGDAKENISPVADFTHTCNDLICDFDASGSYDQDGSIISYAWDFGDGNTGNGITTTHTYLSFYGYTVTLTITDNGNLTTKDTAIVTVEATILFMHVASINMALSTRTAGPNTFIKAIATVTIVDANNTPVEGATVYGSWSGATSDIDSGITNTNGEVTLESDEVKQAPNGTTFIFQVGDVVEATRTYDSNSNTETSDSITVP